jgi:hypothetical protein
MQPERLTDLRASEQPRCTSLTIIIVIDDDLLRRILGEYPGGPKQLKAEGASARNVVGGTVGKGVAFIAAQAYDAEQRKTSKKLNFT